MINKSWRTGTFSREIVFVVNN